MKRILYLVLLLLVFKPTAKAQVTDSYRPGGFDYNGASIKTFSVSDTTAVQFSRGNLQYNPTLDKWRFALRQYQFACNDNANIAEGYDGWIDLFGWGTSGWNSGATAYQPWATSTTITDYQPGGSINNDLAGAYVKADWGIFNKIVNGGNFAGMWRTLTKDEWEYLIGNNTKRSGKWGLATIGGVYNGLMLLPDEWTLPSGCSFSSGNANGYNTNRYTYAEWEKMQAAGAVYLPASGNRYGTEIWDINTQQGDYWSSTHYDEHDAYNIRFGHDYIIVANNERVHGRSVRLVRRVQKPLVQKGWVDMGLPSGTLWYSCNLGTTKPQGYGAYFAWGETKPKSDYSWDTYAHGTGENALTKYCSSASYGLDGFSDGLTVLLPGDDGATTAFGSSARIPTEVEWQELIDNCTSEWTKYNGVNGYMFTSTSNSNSLFLPAAGYREVSSLNGNGIRGRYWSSSLYAPSPYGARYFSFDSNGSLSGNHYRYFGLTIRPVRGGVEPQQESLADAFDANGASIKTFTVAEGRTVHFSKGNLWYNAAANLWRFAPQQYEYIGANNSNISETYNEYIDLFGWGTSGWNSGANAYQPWATSQTNEDYYVGGSYENSLTDEYANADWGVYNAIADGGNASGMWRTLTKDEWEYLLNTRSASTVGVNENARYAKATVNGTAGLIILPDSFTMPSGVTALDKVNVSETIFTANVYNTEDWAKLESAGAIFLPAAGTRDGTAVNDVGVYGFYWSSTYSTESSPWLLEFSDDIFRVYVFSRGNGQSVRLVLNDGTSSTTDPQNYGEEVGGQMYGEWVDLGLPSGTKWYSCNLGAMEPEHNGYYFSWGETRTNKENYGWNTYKYGTSMTTLTKYCPDGSRGLNGFTDTLTVLELSDDAARAALGGSARIPTIEDWQELVNNCSSSWYTMNGRQGYKFTSNFNDNSIFIPAAGCYMNSTLMYTDERCFIWSSSLDLDNPQLGQDLYFDSDGVQFISNQRAQGFPIRAVK